MYIGPWQEYHMNKGGKGIGGTGIVGASSLSSEQLVERDKLITNIQQTLASCLDPAAAALALKNINPLLEANSSVAARINARKPSPRDARYAKGMREAPIPYPKPKNESYWDNQMVPPLSARIPHDRQQLQAPLSGRTSFSEPIVGSRVGLHAKHASARMPMESFSPGADSPRQGHFQSQYSRFMSSSEISQASQASRVSKGSDGYGGAAQIPPPAKARNVGGYSSESVVRLLHQDRSYQQKKKREADKAAQLQQLEAALLRDRGKGPGHAQHWGWSDFPRAPEPVAPVDKNVNRVKKMQSMYMQHLVGDQPSPSPQPQPQPPAGRVTLELTCKTKARPGPGRVLAPTAAGSAGVGMATNLADDFDLTADEFDAVSKYFQARDSDRAELSSADLQAGAERVHVEMTGGGAEQPNSVADQLPHRMVSPQADRVPDFPSLVEEYPSPGGGGAENLTHSPSARAVLPATNYSYARALEVDERRLRAQGDPCSRSGSPRHGGQTGPSFGPTAEGSLGSLRDGDSCTSTSTAGVGGRLGALSPGSPLSASRAGSSRSRSLTQRRMNDTFDLTPSPNKAGASLGFSDSRTSTGGGSDSLDSLLKWSSTLAVDNIDDW